MTQDSKLLGQTRYAAILDDYSCFDFPSLMTAGSQPIEENPTITLNLNHSGTVSVPGRFLKDVSDKNRHERRRAAAESRRKS